MLGTEAEPLRVKALPGEANRLGECPLWCERTDRLWWVDVLTPALWCHDPATGETTRHAVPARRLGSIALRQEGGLLLACDDGLYAYAPESGERCFLVDPEPDGAGRRKNDGRADPAGNFWVGTLEEQGYAPVGRLYRVGADRTVTVVAEELSIPNSLAFDAGRGRMYLADSRAYEIWVFDHDAESGEVSNRRRFASIAPPARPDGSCIDAEGYLWNAEYSGGRLVRYAPTGERDRAIALPVSHPTCCCFGGRDLETLYVTSALEPLTARERADEPLAGRVLALDVGLSGRPEFRVGL